MTTSDVTHQSLFDRARALGRVAVLMGGCSAEREVSLKSGAAVLAALREAGTDAFGLDLGADALAQLQVEPFDRAFIALHGRGGEDGTIQGLLEWMQVPYTGSGVMPSALGMDKLRCKQIWQSLGLPTPNFMLLKAPFDAQSVVDQLGLPLMVKPVHEGSSVGMSKVTSVEALAEAYERACAFDGLIMAEQWVTGHEFTVSLLGEQVLPVIGLETPHHFYDYDAKYITDDTRYLLPCGLSDEAETDIGTLSVAAFNAIGCSGWGRVDLMQDQTGRFWLLEVNTSPGMTDHSLVPQAAAHAGISFAELVVSIAEKAQCHLSLSGVKEA